MTDRLHRSISSGNDSSENMHQGDPQVCDAPAAAAVNCPDRQPNLALETQALQILDSSDDCIKVLDLDGRILFMSRGGQLLLGIQDITPFLNAAWVSFWQAAEQAAASETIAKARAGEVGTFQGYCPTLSGEPKWWECKVSPMRGAAGQIEHLLCISRDITKRKQAEVALQTSEAEFRLFTTASSDTVYKMSADWREMRLLDGKNFLASTSHSSQTWLEQYIPAGEQSRVMAAIAEAIRTRRTFELEHQVIKLDGTIGWTFSRAIPLLDPQGDIIEWLGAASDITVRKRAELSAEFLAIVTQNLAEGTSVQDIIQTVGEQLHRYLQVSICAFVEIDETAEVAVIDHSWQLEDGLSLVGRYHLPEFVTGEFFQTSRLGQPIIVRDVATDSRIADAERFAALKIGSFINVPLIRDNEWKFTLGVYHQTPYHWRNDEIHLMGELANRIWTKLERTRVEEALRESEERYRTLFESIDEGFCVIEVLFNENDKPIDYRFLEINPTFEQLTGLQQAIGKTARQLVPDLEDFWVETYGRVALTGETVRLENTVAAWNRWFDVYACRMGHPQERKVALVFKDISDRKQAEAAIAADLRDTQLLRDLSVRLTTEENIQALYQEIMAAAIAVTQADAGTVQILDEATQDLVLLATQGFERTMTDHFYRVNASSHTPCGIALRSGIRSFVDFDVPASEDPQGSMRMHVAAGYRYAQSTPLITRTGKPIGMVSTHWRTHHRPSERELRFLDLLVRQAADLIEQRQAEAQRQQLLEREQAAREEAEQANRIKDEFLAVLSHELRSPLNPILGWTRLLQAGKLDETRQREALATIERNAKLQTQLIEDLLDISRIIRGKLSLTVAPVNLTFVITAAIETVRLAAEAKQIQILLDLTTAIAPVSGDAARLQQVGWNLLSNAVKFTPNGGQVTVELRQIHQLAQIRVIDTGNGISPDFLPHVFEYFRQADATTTRKFGGLGLGLAIVKQIVEMHGGTVKAESPGEDQGATFTVELPVMQQPPSPVSEPSAAKAANQETLLNNLQVLVVDDDDDTREFQAFLLEQNGARVTAVASGLEALQVFDRCIPDVLVSDVGMAQMDGYMLIQQIRSRPCDRGGNIPAIALTAYAAEVDQQKALQAGFQAHMTKPVDPEALLGAIVSLLRSDR